MSAAHEVERDLARCDRNVVATEIVTVLPLELSVFDLLNETAMSSPLLSFFKDDQGTQPSAGSIRWCERCDRGKHANIM